MPYNKETCPLMGGRECADGCTFWTSAKCECRFTWILDIIIEVLDKLPLGEDEESK